MYFANRSIQYLPVHRNPHVRPSCILVQCMTIPRCSQHCNHWVLSMQHHPLVRRKMTPLELHDHRTDPGDLLGQLQPQEEHQESDKQNGIEMRQLQ